MSKRKKKQPEILKNKKGEVVGIRIDAKRRKNPKNVDEAFANCFSNFI